MRKTLISCNNNYINNNVIVVKAFNATEKLVSLKI